MAYEIGDPNHIGVHNDLIATLAGMGATNLPDTANLGDLGHVADHNLIRDALIQIEAAWGVTGTPLPPVATVGNLGHVDDHNTIDAAIAYLNENGFNEATGGNTVEDVPNFANTGKTWRKHTFTSTGDLTVIKGVQPFAVLIGAGGGGGGGVGSYPGGSGGAGGVFQSFSVTLAPGVYTATIGGAGSGGGQNANGGQGGSSSFATILSGGGGFGAGGLDNRQSGAGTPGQNGGDPGRSGGPPNYPLGDGYTVPINQDYLTGWGYGTAYCNGGGEGYDISPNGKWGQQGVIGIAYQID